MGAAKPNIQISQKYYTKVVDSAWLYPVAHHHGGLVAVI
jgi:hypothetical protein